MSKKIEKGMKVRAFKFEDVVINGETISFVDKMEKYVGVEGVIDSVSNIDAAIKFPDGGLWYYPLSMVAEHLVVESYEGSFSGFTGEEIGTIKYDPILDDFKISVTPPEHLVLDEGGETESPLLREVRRRIAIIQSEPEGITRESMIDNLSISLQDFDETRSFVSAEKHRLECEGLREAMMELTSEISEFRHRMHETVLTSNQLKYLNELGAARIKAQAALSAKDSNTNDQATVNNQ